MAYCELGEILSCLGKFPDALNNYQKSLSYVISEKDQAEILNNLGAFHDQMGQFD